MKILPVGAKLFHADGQTDRHVEGNNRFSEFYERAYREWSTLKYFHVVVSVAVVLATEERKTELVLV